MAKKYGWNLHTFYTSGKNKNWKSTIKTSKYVKTGNL